MYVQVAIKCSKVVSNPNFHPICWLLLCYKLSSNRKKMNSQNSKSLVECVIAGEKRAFFLNNILELTWIFYIFVFLTKFDTFYS